MTENKPLLSVIEELENQKLEDFLPHIFEEDFWTPLFPIRMNYFKKSGDQDFEFEVDDNINLDKAGLIVRHLKASGKIHIEDLGIQNKKGNLWEISIKMEEPDAFIKVRIRARNIGSGNTLKIGIFLIECKFNENLLDGFGKDAVFFAIRINLRKSIQKSIELHK